MKNYSFVLFSSNCLYLFGLYLHLFLAEICDILVKLLWKSKMQIVSTLGHEMQYRVFQIFVDILGVE